MAEKFNNKYRIAPARHQNWDYGSSGYYFTTICTQNRTHYFGEIINNEIQLSQIGVIADILWHEIKKHSKGFVLGEFVVIPNHIHGILIIETNEMQSNQTLLQSNDVNETQTIGQKRFQNQGKNTISSIIGAYKSAVTRHARRLGFEFGWQASFHDHIIRTDQSYQTITNYIRENPSKWTQDKFFTK